MERKELLAQVCGIMAEELSVEAEGINEETVFESDLRADSLDMVQAIMEVEERLGVEIPQEELEGIRTVGQLLDKLEEKLVEKGD